MRKIREILRLKHECGRSNRDIGQSCGIGSSTVSEYLQRVRMAGLAWPLPEGLSDQALEQRLFPPPIPRDTARLLPDFHEIHKELQSRRGVTLNLLWQEYKEQHPDGYQYSWFCQHYRAWSARLDVVMRHEHRAGEKLFVDYAGQTREVVNPVTGAIRQAQIFVAVLGASNYTYAEATWSQQIEDWIGSHVRALAFFGGVPEAIVPDNLKSGVNKACRYEPDINPTYHDLARHYQTVVLPARVRKPRDKAKAEAGVLLVERWILARLRKHTFFSLAELNREITRLLQRLNTHPFKKLPGSRQSCFAQLDRPALKPLPPVPYELARWKKATVHLDYHVEVEGPLLLRALPAGEETGGHPVHRHHRGVPVSGRTGGQPPAGRPARPAYHDQGAHADPTSAVSGVDPGALHPLGSHHRPGNRPPDRNPAGQPGASAAGLPLAAGHPATGQIL